MLVCLDASFLAGGPCEVAIQSEIAIVQQCCASSECALAVLHKHHRAEGAQARAAQHSTLQRPALALASVAEQ